MKTHLTLGLITATTLASGAYAASPTTPAPSREEQCHQFGDAQLKATNFGTISGTTVNSTYNKASGFCTVEITNHTPGSFISSRVATNTFEASPATIRVETVTEPAKPAPQRLLCSKVITLKNGSKVCQPYKPTDGDSFWSPFSLPSDW